MRATHLGREPPVQDHGAVVLVPEGETAVLVLGIGPLGLIRALRLPMEADEFLDMLCGAVQVEFQEIVLVLGGGDAGQRPDLGVTEFALGQRFGEQRQLGQRPGDPDILPGSMGIDSARPAQPVGTGPRALCSPDLAAVELRDEVAQESDLPLGRIGQPEEIASVIAFLAGPGVSYVTGQTFGLNGGAAMT